MFRSVPKKDGVTCPHEPRQFFREKVMDWLLRRQYPEDSAKLADLEMWWLW